MGYDNTPTRTWTRLSDNDGLVFDVEFRRIDSNISTILDGLAKTANYSVLTTDDIGLVRATNSITKVTGKAFSAANPTVITSAAHGLATGDKIVVSNSSAEEEVQNGLYEVTYIGAGTFSIPIDNSGGGGGTLDYRDSVVITMPAAASSTDREVQVMKVDANEGAVVATDGTTEYDLTAQNQRVKLKSDGTNWIEIVPRESGVPDYIKVSDVKAQNTDGGQFTQGAWQTRDINTEDSDTANLCTIDSNQIILAPGTYQCLISCPAWSCDNHQARLYNITDSAVILLGTCEYTVNGVSTDSVYNRSFVVGRFTITAQKTLEVQHRCTTTMAVSGFGLAANFTSEVYTIAEFWKV